MAVRIYPALASDSEIGSVAPSGWLKRFSSSLVCSTVLHGLASYTLLAYSHYVPRFEVPERPIISNARLLRVRIQPPRWEVEAEAAPAPAPRIVRKFVAPGQKASTSPPPPLPPNAPQILVLPDPALAKLPPRMAMPELAFAAQQPPKPTTRTFVPPAEKRVSIQRTSTMVDVPSPSIDESRWRVRDTTWVPQAKMFLPPPPRGGAPGRDSDASKANVEIDVPGQSTSLLSVPDSSLPVGQVMMLPNAQALASAPGKGPGVKTSAELAENTDGVAGSKGRPGGMADAGAGSGQGAATAGRGEGANGIGTGTGNGTASGTNTGRPTPAALPPAVKIVRAKTGRYDAVLSQTTSYIPGTRGLIKSQPVYTVYLGVGDRKEWILQYAMPGDKGAPLQRGGVVQLTNVAPIGAPYAFVIFRPMVKFRDLDAQYAFIHGRVDQAGRFQELEEAGPSVLDNASDIIAALKLWEFRPATRDGVPVALEILLCIPNSAI